MRMQGSRGALERHECLRPVAVTGLIGAFVEERAGAAGHYVFNRRSDSFEVCAPAAWANKNTPRAQSSSSP